MLIGCGRRCEGVQDLYKRSRMPLAEDSCPLLSSSAQSRGEDSLEWGKADGDDDCLAHLPERRGSGRQMSMEQDKGPLLIDVGTPRGRPGIGAREIVGPWRRTIWTRLGKLQDSQGYP